MVRKEVDFMYENLKSLLEQKKITYEQLGSLLNLTPKTVYNKIAGKTEWTLKEITTIKTFALPEYDLNYIFATNT